MLAPMMRRVAISAALVVALVAPGSAEHLGRWERTLADLAEPVDAAFLDDELWVLERGSGRFVVFSAGGERLRTLGEPGALLRPEGFAVGSERLYVADTGHHRIAVFTRDGALERTFGRVGSDAGELHGPHAVAVTDEHVLVADTENHRVQVFTLAGQVVRSFGARGFEPGRFDRPVGIACNRRGEIYVADERNHRIQRFDRDGRHLTRFGARGTAPGLFLAPSDLTWAGGRLIATDRYGGRVQVLDLGGRVLYLWGHPPVRAGEHEGALHEPRGVAVDEELTRAAVCEPLEGRVQLFTRELGDEEHADLHGSHDPLPALGPGGALSGSRLALVDRNDATVAVFDVESIGLVRLGTIGGHGHGLGLFGTPFDVALDGHDDSILVSDPSRRRVSRFRLDPSFPPGDPRASRVIRARAFEREADAEPGPCDELDGLPFEPGALALAAGRRVWVGDTRTRGLVRLGPRFAVEAAVVPALPARGGFTDLAWHPREERLYATVSGGHLVTLDAQGAFERVVEPERAWEPRSVAVAPDGDVVVADAASQSIVVLRQGAVVATLGGRGWEPGRFAGLEAVLPCGDRFYALDRRQRRGQVLARSGRFLMAFGHGH